MRIARLATAAAMVAALSLAACDDDAGDEAATTTETEVGEAAESVENATENAAEETAAATEQAAEGVENAAEETAAATEQAAEGVENAAEETAAATEQAAEEAGQEMADAGAPALAALEGDWAESEEMCAEEAMTLSAGSLTLPDGECEIQSSDMQDGDLKLQLVCPGDTGEQNWTIGGAQSEAKPRNITLDRGDGETVDLVRCE